MKNIFQTIYFIIIALLSLMPYGQDFKGRLVDDKGVPVPRV